MTDRFFQLGVNDRVATLIHECAHLEREAIDFAYYGDPAYPALRGSRALQNADTQASYLMEGLVRCGAA